MDATASRERDYFTRQYFAYLKRFRPDADPERYLAWRTAVFARDGHRCVCCMLMTRKTRHGPLPVHLHADHIKPWHAYPDLRYDVANGRTLCRACHDLIHEHDRATHWRKPTPRDTKADSKASVGTAKNARRFPRTGRDRLQPDAAA